MNLESAAVALRSNNSFLLTSHIDLDGDAVGSELGLALVLERMGKRVIIVNRDPVPHFYRVLPGAQLFGDLSEGSRGVDTAVVLDCTSLERTGEVGDVLIRDGIPIVNIDHHNGNARFGAVNLVRPEACATVVIILELLDHMGERIDPDVSTCLYAGLVSETGSFRLSNTSAHGLAIAARLAREGADPAAIAARLFSRKSPAALRLIGQALCSLEVTHDGALALMCLRKSQLEEGGVTGDELEGIVNFAMSVESARVAGFLRELSCGLVKVSLRSNGTADVDLIARHFGGGGHSNAAGARIPGTLEEVKGTVVDKIAETLRRK